MVPLPRSAWQRQGRIIGVGSRTVHVTDAQHRRRGDMTRSAFAGNTLRTGVRWGIARTSRGRRATMAILRTGDAL
ncbi:hypothetical protein TB9_12570 [Xanthomonas perforans]|uniref:Uncharacterized protein n=1 Tax=Xanthomonas perforans TaxID=442694 RepID=A0AAQ0YRI0_XANPE|nr:hypothetical protein BJD13_13695 [Xanthomonas perforans]AQS76480.1 hypothetical protein XPE_09360 [Xanthomonas perforans 91-118]OHX22373.1 hypothetical protein BHL63_09075 [Xanthomonas alfalfae]OQP38113.1 hypothetical protein IB62_011565 [Xanthomonas euvesicatoria]PPU88374.1 hypothetical protein XaclCFBP3371_13600 [Xanthomonas euvesicatoria pv. citrumelonis]